MAKIVATIPDGQFCADNGHVGCPYEHHQDGLHWCSLCLDQLNPLEEYRVNGERVRLRRKTKNCLAVMTEDRGHGINVDSECFCHKDLQRCPDCPSKMCSDCPGGKEG